MKIWFWIIVILLVCIIGAGFYFAPALTAKVLGTTGKLAGKCLFKATKGLVKGAGKLTSFVSKGVAKKIKKNGMKKVSNSISDSVSDVMKEVSTTSKVFGDYDDVPINPSNNINADTVVTKKSDLEGITITNSKVYIVNSEDDLSDLD